MAGEQPDHDEDDDEDAPSGPQQGEGEIWYINTDLDVHGGPELDLAPLVEALETRGLWTLPPIEHRRDDTGWALVFETNEEFREPDPNIAKMLDAIESLDPEARHLWQASTLRELNIGYDCGDRPWAFNQAISGATLGRMASVGLTLRVTLYPSDASRQALVPPTPMESDPP